MLRHSYSRQLLCALSLLAAAGAPLAGSIELSPVRVHLSAASRVSVLTVKNTGNEETVMQVTLNKWTLEGAESAYTRSQELVITPATFRLAPGAQQIVRVGLRGNAPATNEDAYRLLVEEVPPPPSPEVTQMRLVVRHDLPVFVAPRSAAKSALDVTVQCAADGVRLQVTNIGNVHAQLRNLVLEGAGDRQVLGRWESFDYLLPKAKKNWNLAQVAPGALRRSFMATAQTDQGTFTADVQNPCT